MADLLVDTDIFIDHLRGAAALEPVLADRRTTGSAPYVAPNFVMPVISHLVSEGVQSAVGYQSRCRRSMR